MRSDLLGVDDILSAVWILHHLQIIGEALRSMTQEFQTRFKDSLEWSGWIGLRTIVTHHYFRIDPVLIWEAVERDIPALKTNMLAIREALSSP